VTVSSLIAALRAARDDVPDDLARFDAVVRAGDRRPSFEEYSARVGEGLSPWRETCYFDAAEPGATAVADRRLLAVAEALGFALPRPFVDQLRTPAGVGPEVLQVVVGYDAGGPGAPARLKYYVIFKSGAAARVERLRLAVGAPALPPALDPSTTYIVGVDFLRDGLHDFKIYVRLDPARVSSAIGNLDRVGALRRGSRYLVFQRCLIGGGAQVYFHASAAAVIEGLLARLARREPAVATLRAQVGAMNASQTGRWRPWIASLPFVAGRLGQGPMNVYFHRDAVAP